MTTIRERIRKIVGNNKKSAVLTDAQIDQIIEVCGVRENKKVKQFTNQVARTTRSLNYDQLLSEIKKELRKRLPKEKRAVWKTEDGELMTSEGGLNFNQALSECRKVIEEL